MTIEIQPNRSLSSCSICRWVQDAPTDNVIAVRFGADGGNGGTVVNLCPDHRRTTALLLLDQPAIKIGRASCRERV